MTVGPDVLHQGRQLIAGQTEILTTDVPDTQLGDRLVDLASVGDRAVVAGQHEDELGNLRPLSCLTRRRTVPAGKTERKQLIGATHC